MVRDRDLEAVLLVSDVQWVWLYSHCTIATLFSGLDLDSGLDWTGLLKICNFGAIALPKRPGVQCHGPWNPKH